VQKSQQRLEKLISGQLGEQGKEDQKGQARQDDEQDRELDRVDQQEKHHGQQIEKHQAEQGELGPVVRQNDVQREQGLDEGHSTQLRGHAHNNADHKGQYSVPDQIEEEKEAVLSGIWLSLPAAAGGDPSWPALFETPQQVAGSNSLSQPSNRPVVNAGGACHHWGAGAHVRPFDGNTVLSLPPAMAACEQVLLADIRDNLIKISAWISSIPAEGQRQHLRIRMLLEGEELVLDKDEGQPKVSRRVVSEDGAAGAELMRVPGRLGGLSFELAGGWLFVEAVGLGLMLRWDTQVY
jgi:hypothetical protein